MERLALDEILKLVNEAAVQMELDNCKECSENYKQIAEYLEELKSYKDLEKQDLLVRLPDDLNRVLYQINYRWTECTEYGEENNKCEIYDCKCECDSRKEYYIDEVGLQYIPTGSYYNRLGKTVFLTREEAVNKLEEMKKNG